MPSFESIYHLLSPAAWFGIALVLLFFIFSISYYYRVPKTTVVLQSSAETFEASLLWEKQPLVITDMVTDTAILREALFGSSGDVWTAPQGEWTRVCHAHGVLHAQEDTEILCAAPKTRLVDDAPAPDTSLVAVRLKQHQTLVLPFRWWYYVPVGSTVHLLSIHDAWTRWLPCPAPKKPTAAAALQTQSQAPGPAPAPGQAPPQN